MEYFQYCIACLVTDVKMYRFSSTILSTTVDKLFLQFLRIPLRFVRGAHICFECASLLRKYERFRSKCHRAQDILNEIRNENFEINKNTLKNLNREENKLTSTLCVNSTENITIIDTLNEIPILSKQCSEFDTKPNIDCNNTPKLHSIKNEHVEENTLQNGEYDSHQLEAYFINDTDNKQLKERKAKKEHKSKKRKSDKTDLSQTAFDSSSDNEPLANKVSKSEINGTVYESHRKSFNTSYFEDYATVVFLTPEDAKKELLLRKESSNYINSPFKCDFCYRGYEARTAFDNHMKKHSSDYGQFKCDICHLRFPEQRCLCKHRLASHKRKFCCKLCAYVCFCTHQAKTHVSLHKGKKYPCKECGEIFSMPNSLLMHKRLKHLTECVCDVCGNMFATPRGLYSHHVKLHRQDKNEKQGPKCQECNIHFASEEAWKRHLVLSSKHNVSNGCKNCGETFSSIAELKAHARIHARKHTNRSDNLKLPSACTICTKWLVDRTEYKAHMLSEHPRSDITRKLDAEELSPFVCELCGLTFKKQCFLTYHQRKHTGERPYKCAQCNKTFQLAGALSTHKAIHLQRRTHKCTVCDRVFTFKSALNKHMKVHLNIRPHRCDICEKSFISPCDVRLHIKYVHNKVPWPKRDRTKKNIGINTFTQY